ncbi:MAG TPA: DUF1361 domain-containing protein [Candidatus Saccharimonadales bacterium]|jgi:uncharacterized membrane protein
MVRNWDAKKQLVLALAMSSLVGVILFSYCAIIDHSVYFSYLLTNLLLAWIPLIVSIRLVYVLRYKRWSSWEAMGWSFLWLVFLPNSFYMISDFIHLQSAPTDNITYYAVTFTSFIYTATVIGFLSLYLIHSELKKRFNTRATAVSVAAILAICSEAIYIGRDLRWDSWAVLTNPGGLIFDISDRLIHISDYPSFIGVGAIFFILLGSMYFLAWSGIKAIKRERI